MSHYQDELSDYEQSADEYFDNYQGFEGVDPQYSNYAPAMIGRIDPLDRTYTIRVENSGQDPEEAIIFGGNENAEQPKNVTVTVQESSHNEVREESKSNPFKILGLKMRVSDPFQFDNVLRIVHRRSSGFYQEQKYQPRNASSPQNFDSKMIDDEHFEMDVTGHDSLRFTIMPSTMVSFTFTVKARTNMGNLLKGMNVAEMSTSPRTTGLPQLDLVRKQTPPVFGLPQGPRRPAPRPFSPSAKPPTPPPTFVLRKSDRR